MKHHPESYPPLWGIHNPKSIHHAPISRHASEAKHEKSTSQPLKTEDD
jgi:hypothetical protein